MSAHNVEDIYGLSPLQFGMLYHSLEDTSDTRPYMVQMTEEVEGPFDETLFGVAWQQLVDRHSILRSAFVWEGVSEPVQVVQRRGSSPLRSEGSARPVRSGGAAEHLPGGGLGPGVRPLTGPAGPGHRAADGGGAPDRCLVVPPHPSRRLECADPPEGAVRPLPRAARRHFRRTSADRPLPPLHRVAQLPAGRRL